MIRFEWNSTKARLNHEKHGVSFEEAETVFYDANAIQFYDESHSQLKEDRFLLLGFSNKSRMVIVCHCEKNDGELIRIISARKATKTEVQFYTGDYYEK